MIRVKVKLIVVYLIVNLKVNISGIVVQVKVMIGVEVKLITVSSMELN